MTSLAEAARTPGAAADGAEPSRSGRARSSGGSGTGDRRPATSWDRRDTLAAAVLAGIPAVLLSLAAVIGYPLMTGDDVAQNYPLGVLTGEIIRHGHLPLFDSFLWSGSPLLAGANAHPFLPTSLLFVVLPPIAAWVVGEILVLALAAVGCQLLLCRTGCGTLAAAVGGASFGFGGYVSSQIVHIDFVAAAAALPWAIVGMIGIATGLDRDRRARHALLLALAVGWVGLAGSPDIVIDAVVLGVAIGVHLLVQPAAPGRRATGRVALAGWTAGAVAVGLAIGAVQWWTAARFVAESQRAHTGVAFLSFGSLSPANIWTLFVPHVLGGGPIGLTRYASGFPLAEINAYPGVLALAALAVLAARWRAEDAWRWRVWLVLALAGIVLALGGHTPIEQVLAHLPIAGQQRLPARALVLVALSSAVCLGYFLDGVLSGRADWRRRSTLVAGALPLVVVLGVVALTVATGRPVGGALHPEDGSGWSVGAVAPALALSSAFALAGIGVLLLVVRPSQRIGRRWSVIGLAVALVVVDLVVFDVNQSSLAPIHASALAAPTSEEHALARIAAGGRTLVLDPSLAGGDELTRVGPPDLSILAGLPSAEGYGSLTWGPYAAATGTHSQAAVALGALSNGTFDSLDVTAVAVLPSGLGPAERHALFHSALRPPRWRRVGEVGGFEVWRNLRATPALSGMPARLLDWSPWTGSASVLVSAARPGTLVRSVADIPGWQATERPAGALAADAHPVTIRRHGLVQAVQVPAGRTIVSFDYRPPGWPAAKTASLAGVAAAIALALLGAGVGRRREELESLPEPEPAIDPGSASPLRV